MSQHDTLNCEWCAEFGARPGGHRTWRTLFDRSGEGIPLICVPLFLVYSAIYSCVFRK